MRRLEGKLAVVTGAANGIGRASALRFADEGANLAILDLEADGLEAVAEEARAKGAAAIALAGDCTKEDFIVDAFKAIYGEFGFIDMLMNNVGQSARERASEFYKSSSEVWRFVFDVTLFSGMLASRQVVPAMREAGRGKIVNVASNAGMAGEIGISEYAAAKMGVIGFTRSLARELAPFKVNVNAVCPGVTKTRVIDRISGGVSGEDPRLHPARLLRRARRHRRRRRIPGERRRPLHDRPVRGRRRRTLDDLKPGRPMAAAVQS